MSKKELTLDYFRKQGAKGGKLGGALAWEGLSTQERSDRARAAVSQRPDVKAKREREAAAAKKAAKKAAPTRVQRKKA